MDAFELTGDKKYLTRATELIQGTVHPTDNIAERNLLDAETRWSYTVFLAAVGRYLVIKQLWNQLDQDFSHARQSLLTYGCWMVENEYPYLDKSEILEYPNETWIGQDLRKGVVLHYAVRFADPDERARFRVRAEFFFDYGLKELCRQATGHYTRPLALLMQNGWAREALDAEIVVKNYSGLPKPAGCPTYRMNLVTFLRQTGKDFVCTLLSTGVKREWNWIRKRSVTW